MQYQNDLILRAARGEKTERTPVWVMRQAGRILPEYLAVRNSLRDFKELVETPDRAAEVTIQPVDILGVDAAIIFSDILVVPEAMGLPYQMIEKRGPWFEHTVRSEKDLARIQVPDVHETLGYVMKAIEITKKELNGRVPVIGFAGAPFTILAYMVEGSGSKTFSETRKMLYTQPELSHRILQMITDTTIAYLQAQVVSGAAMLQLFDSWAGILSPEHYRIFAIPYIKQICDAVTDVPVTVFAKGAFFARKDLAQLNCRTIGLDWNMDIAESRALVGPDKTLQGNMDPCLLYSEFNLIEKETKKMLAAFGGEKHIANLGHGVYPDTKADAVKCFIDTVKNYQHTQQI
ncbi:MAG: uroporphyrinogen decarboxylase [Bacteroidota bacterium]